ncbi:gamma-glutamylaminecyclotransferase-like [Chanos chanos]|uniref:Gamma-glutamylaminecyclotransferase n=1 Tax=Chanos chanos TaxID=29144 RepID=A0A6J2VX96_CHACN|nr:gamma-glutamylaminecyclotransferase-like [Chanos chanos]
MTHVFVYGTLKKGQPNHHRMLDPVNGKAEYCGRARTVEKYPLVIAGPYNIPFLLNVPGEGQRVHGEIYKVNDQMIAFLDHFESCPDMYQRTRVKLEVDEWVETGGEDANSPRVGSVIETFVYNTTTYQPEWRSFQTHESYDACGDHGLVCSYP